MEKRQKPYMWQYYPNEAGQNPKPIAASAVSTVHLGNDMRVCYDDDCVRRALVARGIRRMEDICKARAIVALDDAKPHHLNQVVAALMGLVVGTPEFSKSGSSKDLL